MRRIWAYILTAFTLMMTVGVSFVTIGNKINTNIEFDNGKEITYRISPNFDDEEARQFLITSNNIKETDAKDTDINIVANEMKTRLSNYEISSFQIKTVGEDTIKVSLTDNNTEIARVNQLLSTNSKMALVYNDTLFVELSSILNGTPYVTTYNKYPCVILPVDVENSSFKEIIGQIKEDVDNKNRKYAIANSESSGEEGETRTTYTYALHLVSDFIPSNWNYEDSITNGGSQISYNQPVVLDNEMAIGFVVYSNLSDTDTSETAQLNLYYPDDQNNKLFFTSGLTDGSASDKTISNQKARFVLNLINAGTYDVKVENICTTNASGSAAVNYVDPWSESLKVLSGGHENIAFSYALKATLVAYVIVTILLIVFFRLSSVSIVSLTTSNLFIAFLSLFMFNAEFNTFGVIALVMVGIASIACGIIYAAKLKQEAYKGRSVKKANQEASKKSLLPIVDINVALIVLGIFLYIFGGTLCRNMAGILFVGGLASMLFNTLVLKGMMWLATNATSMQGKYGAFGIDAKKVPSLIEEEKQTYFGPYADKDFTKHKKKMLPVAAVLLGISIFGMIFFGIKNNGFLYSQTNTTYSSEIYLETEDENSPLHNKIDDYLNDIKLYEKHEDIGVEGKEHSLSEYIGTTKFYEDIRVDSSSKTEKTVYRFVGTLNGSLAYSNKLFARYNNYGSQDTLSLNEVLSYIAETSGEIIDENVSLVKDVANYNMSAPTFGPIALASLISTAVLTVYFLLRYRLSRGLANFVTVAVSGAITTGLLSVLFFLNISNYAIIATPIVVLFASIISICFMNREREMFIEDKNKSNEVEYRNQLMIKATSSSCDYIIPISLISGYLMINYFGFGPAFSSWIFALGLIGIIASGFIIVILQGPISQAFYKLFKSKGNKPEKVRKKVKVAKPNKSAEPEEAIFIGIND